MTTYNPVHLPDTWFDRLCDYRWTKRQHFMAITVGSTFAAFMALVAVVNL